MYQGNNNNINNTSYKDTIIFKMKQHSKRGALQLKMLFAAVVLTLSISASTGTVYNRSCYNPLAYLGTANATYNSATNTCNYWYAGFSGSGQVFENVTWGNVNASTFPSGDAVNKINSLKGSCCSDGKGILWNAPAPSPAPSANITSPALDLNTDDSKRRVSFHFIVSSIMPTIFALMQSIRFV